MPLGVHRSARLVFLALLAVAGAGVWYFLSPGNRIVYGLETHDSISGLREGAPVEMHGVEIGTVKRVRLADPQTVDVELSIDRNAPITRATRAVVTARGLAARGFMGYVYVALEDSGTDRSPVVPDAAHRRPMIAAGEPQIDTLDTSTAAALHEMQTLTHLLRDLLDPAMIASLKETAGNAHELLALLVAHEDRLQSLAANLEQDTRQISLVFDDKTVASLKRSAEATQDVVGTLAANSKTLAALIGNAEYDSRNLRPLLNTSGATVEQLRTQLLPALNRTMGDLDDLTRTMKPLAARAARDPSILIRGTVVPPGPGEQ